MQSIVGADVSVNVQRSVSRLKSFFMTLDGRYKNPEHFPMRKQWNNFYHPMNKNGGFRTNAAELEFRLYIGNTLYPDYPITSQSEFFYNLRKCLGICGSTWHSIDITGNGVGSYNDSKFIIGIDTEKSLGASYTGIETNFGGLMQVKLKTMDTNMFTLADFMHIILVSDQVIKLKATGVIVLE